MRLTIFLILACLSFQVNSQDLKRGLREANALVSNEQYAEALEKFIWIHNQEHEKESFDLTGLSALYYWKRLGEKYPPAIQALKDIRDRKSADLKSCGTDHKLFQDVVAINTCLHEDSESITLFSIILNQSPALAAQCWDFIDEYLFKKKAYDIIRLKIKDPVAEYSRYESKCKLLLSFSDEPKFSGIKKMAEEHFADRVISIIEFSKFISDTESAKEIKKRALAVVGDQKIKEMFID